MQYVNTGQLVNLYSKQGHSITPEKLLTAAAAAVSLLVQLAVQLEVQRRRSDHQGSVGLVFTASKQALAGAYW